MLRPEMFAHYCLHVMFPLSPIVVLEVSKAGLAGYWLGCAQRE
jgi:hypothetical protein